MTNHCSRLHQLNTWPHFGYILIGLSFNQQIDTMHSIAKAILILCLLLPTEDED